MSGHARLSPSSRHRWARCPGSVREEAKYPESTSDAADDGTHSHTLLEHCLVNEYRTAHNFAGMTLTDHVGSFTVTPERADRVTVALEYVAKRLDELGSDARVYSERKVNPELLVKRDDMLGTIDITIRHNDFLEVIDYKDGVVPVNAEKNPQLEQYTIGLLAELCVGKGEVITRVRQTIIQPKLAIAKMTPIAYDERPIEFILPIATTLIAEAAATDDPNAPLVAGTVQCKYCKAKGRCMEFANSSLEKAGVVFPIIETAPLDIATQAADKDPSQMSDVQIVQIIEAAPLLKSLIDAVEKEAHNRLTAGKPIAGLKLVSGRGARSWNQSEEVIAAKLVKLGVPKSAVYVSKLVSPPQAEKLTWEKKDGSKVSLSEKQLKLIDTEYVSHLAGKPTVVLESDSRPALVVDASPLFSAVEVKPELPAWLTA